MWLDLKVHRLEKPHGLAANGETNRGWPLKNEDAEVV